METRNIFWILRGQEVGWLNTALSWVGTEVLWPSGTSPSGPSSSEPSGTSTFRAVRTFRDVAFRDVAFRDVAFRAFRAVAFGPLSTRFSTTFPGNDFRLLRRRHSSPIPPVRKRLTCTASSVPGGHRTPPTTTSTPSPPSVDTSRIRLRRIRPRKIGEIKFPGMLLPAHQSKSWAYINNDINCFK